LKNTHFVSECHMEAQLAILYLVAEMLESLNVSDTCKFERLFTSSRRRCGWKNDICITFAICT
jgi:restriction endonuclease Mrr